MKAANKACICTLMLSVIFSAKAESIFVANHSFESPYVEPVYPYAYPVVNEWIEMDVDVLYSANTGVFVNVTQIAGGDGYQMAFLGGENGNALLQDLTAVYQPGKSYKLTAGICISGQYAPVDPNGLALSFYYRDPNIVYITTELTPQPSYFSVTALEDNSVFLPKVEAGFQWAGKPIGIAIRATGPMGGYWDIDNVRVTEYPLLPDNNGDAIVNLADFVKIAADWLSCNGAAADVTGDGCVDYDDLYLLASYWLDS